MIYRYTATIKKENDVYTVAFPAFGVKGQGYSDYGATVDFAGKMLAEIIMDYEAGARALPHPNDSVGFSFTSSDSDPQKLVIEVDADQYKRRADENAGRVFYEFETDEDVKKRNSASKSRLFVIAGIAALVLIAVIVIGMQT